ncbi:MAG: DUF4124 domain-containing protein [Acidiferrobacterales bacterium]
MTPAPLYGTSVKGYGADIPSLGVVIMQKPFIAILSLLALFVVLAAPARSAVYIWKDAKGVTNFTDDRAKVPDGVRFEVRSYGGSSAAAEPPARRAVTQGEFARQLAAELGLGPNLTAERAVDALSRARIGPQLGNWELDSPLTRALLDRLRKLTVGAAQAGTITLTTEEALIAFDSAVSLVGVSIRQAAAPSTSAPQPVAAPPPVYVIPPSPVVYERTILVGGGIVNDPFLLPGLLPPAVLPEQPVIQINNRVVNKRVVVVRPRQVKRNRPRVVQPVPDRPHARRPTRAAVQPRRVIRPATVSVRVSGSAHTRVVRRVVTPIGTSTRRIGVGGRVVSTSSRMVGVTGGRAISRSVR